MLLSICIPSYNRFEHLNEVLKSLNKCESDEFEVVVVDNGSNEDIETVICTTQYSIPVRIIKRSSTVSGIANPRDCINFGYGLYRFLCLDKDFVDGTKLGEFIDFLQKNKNVCGGYCSLNVQQVGEKKIYSKKNFSSRAYKINHPSGVFIREDILKVDNDMLDYLNPQSIYYDFPFICDLLIARCMYCGKLVVYNAPLVNTESEDEAKTTKTHSYDKNNIYFSPSNKRKQMHVYFKNMNSLIKEKKIYHQTMARLFKQVMADNSIHYIQIMSNEKICLHYGLQTRIVPKKEAIVEMRRCQKEIINSSDCRLSTGIKFILTETIRLIITLKMMLK